MSPLLCFRRDVIRKDAQLRKRPGGDETCLIKDETSWSLMCNESDFLAIPESSNSEYTAKQPPRSQSESKDARVGKTARARSKR